MNETLKAVRFAGQKRFSPAERARLRSIAPAALPLVTVLLAALLQVGVITHWGATPLLSAYTAFAALNVGCTMSVVVSAWRLHGQLRLRLTRTLNTAILMHGLLALTVLIIRLPFSRPAMLLALGVSLAGGTLIVFLRECSAGPRVGMIQDGIEPIPLVGAEILTSPEEDLRRYNVILTPMKPLSAEWSASLSRAMLSGAQLRHAAEYLEEARGQTSVRHFHIDHLSDRAGQYEWVKRAADLALTVFFLPVTLPLMLVTAGLVLLFMGRPVLFVQDRVGIGGRRFRMFKFRTMARGSPEHGAATVCGDQRVTSLGRVLRRYRLDELPQFLNIARGDMSLIGPRPEWVVLHEEYASHEPAYVYRNLVRPGLTGWAQVRSGYAGDLAETRVKLSYDLYYVKNLSLGLDLQIALRTLWALISGYGAR